METIEAYLAFLWTQFQYDWSVLSNPWVLYTVIPAIFYLVFFLIKWWVLLAPITVPITTFTHGLKQVKDSKKPEKVTVKDQLEQLLKG